MSICPSCIALGEGFANSKREANFLNTVCVMPRVSGLLNSFNPCKKKILLTAKNAGVFPSFMEKHNFHQDQGIVRIFI